MSKPGRDTPPIRPQYTIVFEALPCETPPPIRLRKLLKFALRSLNMRCTAARETATNDSGDHAGGANEGPVLDHNEQNHLRG